VTDSSVVHGPSLDDASSHWVSTRIPQGGIFDFASARDLGQTATEAHMPDTYDEHAITIYTDGSSFPGPRRGGMGIIYVVINDSGDVVTEDYQPPGYERATNNSMELQAPIEALTYLMKGRTSIETAKYRKVIIRTDSRYVADYHKTARFTWSKNQWRNSNGRPIDNATQWKNLLKIIDRSGKWVEFEWVKGHKTSEFNKAADRLARKSALGVVKSPMTVAGVRRKRSNLPTERGNVPMLGQELAIHIIGEEFYRLQKVWKYRYEVISDNGLCEGAPDFAYSDAGLLFRSSHSYRVQMGTDQEYPQIVALIEEIPNPMPPSKGTTQAG
jgi:ribonuclease HI